MGGMVATLEDYRNEAFVKYCEKALGDFLEQAHGVHTVLLATPDGFEIASKSDGGGPHSSDNLAAVGSTLFSLGSSVGEQLSQGICRSITIDNEKGKVYISAIDGGGKKSLILLLETTQQAMLAHILHGSRKLAESIGKRLSLI